MNEQQEREATIQKAYEMWKSAGGDKAPHGTLKKISEETGLPEGTIRRIKSEKWMPEQMANVRANVQSKNATIKWEDLKREFMCNEYKDLKEFAEKHNLAYGTGSFNTKTSGWLNEKKESRKKINEKVIEHTEKEIEDELTKLNKRHIDVSTKIMNKAEEALGELNKYVTWIAGKGLKDKEIPVLDVDKLLKITKSLSEVQKIQRTALGIKEGNPEKGSKVDSEIKQSVKDMSDEELRRLADE